MKNILPIVVLSIALIACNGKSSETTTDSPTETVEATTSSLAYQRAFTKITWTAYKTTAKIGVSGTFKDFEVSTPVESGSVTELLNGLNANIAVTSVFSDNVERDGKLKSIFFGSMAETESIVVDFKSVDGADTAGTINMTVAMNGVSKELAGNYTVENNKVVITSSLDLGDWDANSSVKALNEACDDLHKGEDGVSKLWPTVDVTIESTLKEVSNEDI